MNCSTRPKPKAGVCPLLRKGGGNLNSYADIVRVYVARYRDNARSDLDFYANQKSFGHVIEFAGLAKRADGKRQSHQRRLSPATLRRAYAALRDCDFEACKSFADLIELVQDAIGNIGGIGRLTVYDTARRIGAYLKLEPEKVYLHAGTRAGARALGIDHPFVVEIEELPTEFQTLTAGEIEDCLCIYKDVLKRIADSQ